MGTFHLLQKLPPILEVRLKGTGKSWKYATPRLTIVGSKIWLSYGVGAMDCILYERAEDEAELNHAIFNWVKTLRGKKFLDIDSVFVDGKKIEA